MLNYVKKPVVILIFIWTLTSMLMLKDLENNGHDVVDGYIAIIASDANYFSNEEVERALQSLELALREVGSPLDRLLINKIQNTFPRALVKHPEILKLNSCTKPKLLDKSMLAFKIPGLNSDTHAEPIPEDVFIFINNLKMTNNTWPCD